MSDRNKSEGTQGQEEKTDHGTQAVPGSSSPEPTTTPNTPPLPRESGSSEADPAGIDNVTDSMPSD